MKQYVVDELRPEDHARLKGLLDERYAVEGFDGLYRIFLSDELLNDRQKTHPDCKPFYFALELMPDRLMCELLVRTNQRIRCDCIAYASEQQRNWLIQHVDQTLADLGISV